MNAAWEVIRFDFKNRKQIVDGVRVIKHEGEYQVRGLTRIKLCSLRYASIIMIARATRNLMRVHGMGFEEANRVAHELVQCRPYTHR